MTTKEAILCVDDEAIIVFAMKQELKRHYGGRFVYETALDAEEALEIIDDLVDQGIEVVVVISDWLMPGMKGDEFLIRVHDKYPQIGLIMVTGQADDGAIERAIQQAKISTCLKKPWRSQDLIAAIDDILKKAS
ncbi:MAG TPA: response regulator [Termitinemataceae bacterium]|jgi:DNA-binding NtrC family response regulator|nr:response regulator [Termitinemataceae bacterium]HOM22288.1 response regulator [Termitinemataceae bacterium]HPP99290.1 response regulator [Termitinemataceae bacterium]